MTGVVNFTYIVKVSGNDLIYPVNGHAYEFISAIDISWTLAKANAEAMSRFGMPGYLVTVTSQGEQDFVKTKLQGQGWMGATDVNVPNQWQWVTGPEAGTVFFNQTPGGSGGTPVSGAYINWLTGEPNNYIGAGDYSNGESYAHFRTTGFWNDFPVSTASPTSSSDDEIKGYIVEYSTANCTPILTATGSVVLTLGDTQAPVISCPSNITVNTATGVCTASGVTLGSPTVTDNCNMSITPTNNAQATYAIGSNTVTWTANDGNGNIHTCPQTVTVVDNQAPVITCPANITVNMDAGLCTASGVTLGTATVTDTCNMSITPTNNAPTSYALGVSTITWTANDGNGNTNTCIQTVTVIDNQPPVITCPASITLNTGSAESGNSFGETRSRFIKERYGKIGAGIL